MIGLKTYLKLTREADRALGSAVEVVFFPGGYCGFQKVEDGRVNACMAISADRFQSHGGSWPDTARAMTASSVRAAELLAGAEPMLDKPVAVGRVPYGYVRKASSGVFHIGDQAVVIPSFCGEGMGLALRSGRLAAEAYLEGLTASAFQTRFARLAGPRVKGAALLSRLLTHSAAQGAALRTASLAPALVSRLAAVTRTPDERRLSG
jgi:flavin-dependent dehydrogenase